MTNRGWVKAILIGGTIALFLALYIFGARRQLHIVNTNQALNDQTAYMNYARKLVNSGYTYPGNFARMPLYPHIQSLFYRPGMAGEDFFLRGKYVNLYLSILLLAGLAIIFFYEFRPLSALNLILIIAFTVFIFKAGYFQAELLFYFLNFCMFWLMWRFLQKPSPAIAVLGGITAGLAYLTKAAILPGLALFVFFAGVQNGYRLIGRIRSKSEKGAILLEAKHLLSVALFGLFFLVTIFPYIQDVKSITGRYFYNVNSNFYIWYDSWGEVKRGTRAHGDREGWPDIPAEELPSMSKYLREHSAQQIVMRFVNGGRQVLGNVVHSYGYFKYVLIYLGIFGLTSAIYRQKAGKMFASNWALWLFLASFFVVYALMYFWFAPISSGNRQILALFIPLLFVLTAGIQEITKDAIFRFRDRQINVLTGINLAILLVVIFDVFFILTQRVGSLYGGS